MPTGFRIALLCGLALTIALRAQPPQRVSGQGAGAGRDAPTNNAIVGHVRTPDGRPAVGALIVVLRPSVSTLRPFDFDTSVRVRKLTDADGAYRIDGLPLGECFVLAFPRNETGTPQQPARAGFGRTLFPNTSDIKRADRVVVTSAKPSTATIFLDSKSKSRRRQDTVGVAGSWTIAGTGGLALRRADGSRD